MGAVTEYTTNSWDVIFSANLDFGGAAKGTHRCRGFWYPWVGKHREIPAVVAETGCEDLKICVSWNGDTETKTWHCYAVDVAAEETTTYRSRYSLGKTPRKILRDLPQGEQVARAEAPDDHGGGLWCRRQGHWTFAVCTCTKGRTPGSEDAISDKLARVALSKTLLVSL